MAKSYTIRSDSVIQTRKIAGSLARYLSPGCNLILTGDLGAGKTTFTKALAKPFGINSIVTSPSFTILKKYKGRIDLYHFDLYRLSGLDEMADLDLEDVYNAGGITVIEWGNRLESLLPDDYIEIELKNWGGKTREIVIRPKGRSSSEVIDRWYSRFQKGVE